MEAQVSNNETLQIIERSADLVRNGGQILLANQSRAAKAVAVGSKILSDIQANGGKLNASLDERAMKYLANCSAALKDMQDQRKEVTQIMDALKKLYTEAEGQLDVKKAGTPAAIMQQHRNDYAREQAEEARRREQEAARQRQKESEAVELKAEISRQFYSRFNRHLSSQKQIMSNDFNLITLENYEAAQNHFSGIDPVWKYSDHSNFQPDLLARHHVPAELQQMISGIISETFEAFAAQFRTEMLEHRQSILDKLPSKKAELERIAEQERLQLEEERRQQEAERIRKAELQKAEGEKKKQLEEQQRVEREQEQQRLQQLEEDRRQQEQARLQREEADRQRLAQEEAGRKRRAEEAIELQKAEGNTLALFNETAAVAEAVQAPEARQGYEINVTHQAGFVQIFQFWFEREGKNLPIDKMGNTKLDQMKGWCEKLAHKTGEQIESKFLSYVPTYKAVNRKATA
jgi:hypothetical protein